jgi:WD40 repeat protein
LPAAEVVTLGVELARGLGALHAHGLVHRDIKPSNVIYVGGAPKLADIGLVATASAALTFVGTEGYVPPEGPGAPAADVFSLGKVLYELATGLDRRDYPSLPAELAQFSDRKELLELNAVIVRACEPDARNRFSDAAALRDELLLLQAGKSVRRLRAAERRTARALKVAGVLAIVAAIAGVSAFIEHRRATALSRQKTYSGNLASAQRALGNDDFRRARRLLEELIPKFGEEDLRGFEWYALWRDRFGDPHEVIREDGPPINRLAVSPDESLLAVQDSSGILTLYDVATRRELRRVKGVQSFAGFSSDGQWLLGQDSSLRLRRWAASDGEPEPPSDLPRWLPIAARGENELVAVSAGPPLCIHIWNFAEHRETFQQVISDKSDDPPCMLFRSGVSKDGKSLVLAEVKGRSNRARFRLSMVRLDDSRLVVQREMDRARPSAVGFDEQGGWAVLDTTGEVWRCDTMGWGRTTEVLPVGTRKHLGTRVEEGIVRITSYERRLAWEPHQRRGSTSIIGRAHSALISDFVVSKKHETAYSAATDGSLFCWPIDGPIKPATTFRAWDSNAGATGAVFNQDSKSVWVPFDGNSCLRLETTSLAITAKTTNMRYPIALIGNHLIGATPDAGLVRVDPETGSPIGQIEISDAPILLATVATRMPIVAAIDARGNLLASDSKGAIRVRDGIKTTALGILNRNGRRYWMTTQADKMLQCLSWPEGKTLWQQSLATVSPYFALSPNEHYLIIALENGMLELRDSATGNVTKQIDSGSGAPQALAFTPDGRRLFAGGIEGEIHCFDTERWEEVHSVPLGVNERLHRLDCSPDGKTLVAFTKTGTLHIIRAE